jgi:hypothetical protein
LAEALFLTLFSQYLSSFWGFKAFSTRLLRDEDFLDVFFGGYSQDGRKLLPESSLLGELSPLLRLEGGESFLERQEKYRFV